MTLIGIDYLTHRAVGIISEYYNLALRQLTNKINVALPDGALLRLLGFEQIHTLQRKLVRPIH